MGWPKLFNTEHGAFDPRRYGPSVIAVLVIISGFVNLWSAAIGPLPNRLQVIDNVIDPTGQITARFITVVLGFLLLMTGVQLIRRKRRAWVVTMFVLGASLIAHILKGLDFEEASWTAGVLIITALGRSWYDVSSTFRLPGLNATRIAIVLAGALSFGVIGFTAADQGAFGREIGPGLAWRETVNQLTFGPSELHARNTEGRVLLMMFPLLSIMTLLALAGSIYSPFRAAQMIRLEADRAQPFIEKYGRSTSDFFKLWPDKRYFFTPNGVIAYGVAGRVAIAHGEPSAPVADVPAALAHFHEYCRRHDWTPAFFNLTSSQTSAFRAADWRLIHIGSEAIVDVAPFSLAGPAVKKLRNIHKTLSAAGWTARWVEPPLDDALLHELQAISQSWLTSGQRVERGFLVGHFRRDYLAAHPVFIATHQQQPSAFVNLIPSPLPGTIAIDLMRRTADSPGSIMDFLLAELLMELQRRGFSSLSLGGVPLSDRGLDPELSGISDELLGRLRVVGERLFRISGLEAFKSKFADRWEPHYLAYRSRLDLPVILYALNRLMRV